MDIAGKLQRPVVSGRFTQPHPHTNEADVRRVAAPEVCEHFAEGLGGCCGRGRTVEKAKIEWEYMAGHEGMRDGGRVVCGSVQVERASARASARPCLHRRGTALSTGGCEDCCVRGLPPRTAR